MTRPLRTPLRAVSVSVWLSTVLLTWSAAAASAQDPEDSIPSPAALPSQPAVDTAAVTRWVESMMGPGQFPAAAVVIADRSGARYVRVFGESGTDRPLGADSHFYIGSTTKTMTAAGIMTQVDEGRIALDSPVRTYLPDLAFSDEERGARLTVEHLLRHQSGLPRIAAFNRRVQQTGRIDHVRFEADPGDVTEYNSLNFQLLGAVIEAVSGRPYAEFMADRVFRPAGMTGTTALRKEAQATLVQGHSYFFGFAIPRDEPEYAPRMVPTGYVVTTPDDVASYLRMLLADGGDVLSPEATRAIRTPASGETGTGLGWGVTRHEGRIALNHAGMTPGFYSRFMVFPEEGLGFAVLTARNAGPFADAPTALMNGVVRAATGGEPDRYVSWERFIRLAILIVLLLDLRRVFVLGKAWKRVERPRAVAHTKPVLGRLVFDLTAIAAIPLWIMLGLAKMPIQGFLEFYPDLGIALILMPVLGIPTAVLRALVRSEIWRRESYAGGQQTASA